jgi:hypothetical protein
MGFHFMKHIFLNKVILLLQESLLDSLYLKIHVKSIGFGAKAFVHQYHLNWNQIVNRLLFITLYSSSSQFDSGFQRESVQAHVFINFG